MIEEILPPCVAVEERRYDPADATLFPDEEAVVARAVEKRRREFTTARMCARAALQKLGFATVSIPTGERGEPLWPTGALGSITHCDGYRAAAVARSREVVTLGIDAERNAPLPDGLVGDIARPEELPSLRRLAADHPEVHWDRLLFSAKESVYKAWFPLARSWLGFEDAIVVFDPNACTFEVRLLVAGPQLANGPLQALAGRWIARDGIVLTAISLTRT
ncbi:MAG TPA: 4'-phosphopantetheinyl transferase superfamily protein [Solirubrobacteraceae bacterium]|nr:4'-phosphopantetheinyl transferase superfamily protein [Solirubrobacteraceae bacterium]